jgi:hypothetical protein
MEEAMRMTQRIEDLSDQLGYLHGKLDGLRMLVNRADIIDAESEVRYPSDTVRVNGAIDTKDIKMLFEWPTCDDANALYAIAKANAEVKKKEKETEKAAVQEEESEEQEEETEPEVQDDPLGVKAAAKKIQELAGGEPKKEVSRRGKKIDREKAYEHIQTGMSAKELAHEMGIGISSANRIMKEYRDDNNY